MNALGLGTAALGTRYGAPGGERDAPASRTASRTIARALEAGVRFIDTAPAYGEAERIVGEACAGAECAVATKVAIPAGGWEGLAGAAVAEHVRRSCERSLEALRRSRLDLLQIHNADAALIARDEIPAALEALRGEGLVAACGATVYGEENALAAIACPTFDAVQIAYSALDRRPERSVLPAARAAGTSVIARSVLLRGVLSSAGGALAGAVRATAPRRRCASAGRRRVVAGAARGGGGVRAREPGARAHAPRSARRARARRAAGGRGAVSRAGRRADRRLGCGAHPGAARPEPVAA